MIWHSKRLFSSNFRNEISTVGIQEITKWISIKQVMEFSFWAQQTCFIMQLVIA